MREGLIILVALIGAGFIVYYFDKYRNRRYPESKPQNQGGNWDAFWHFCFHSLVLSWLFISQLLSAINSARRPVFCGH